jgi:hypothetical protein
MRANKAVKSLFPGFETSGFPVDQCVAQDKREPEILNSNTLYLCVVVDHVLSDRLEVRVLSPYVCKLEEGHMDFEHSNNGNLFGWNTPNKDSYVDHFEHNIHDDDDVVVAWKRIDSAVDFVKTDTEGDLNGT